MVAGKVVEKYGVELKRSNIDDWSDCRGEKTNKKGGCFEERLRELRDITRLSRKRCDKISLEIG